MDYWIFVTTRDNWGITREKNVLGFAQRYKRALSRVHKTDKGLIYIIREYAVSGEYEIKSNVYVDDERIFNSPYANPNETYPLRLDVECLTPSAAPIPFKPLIAKLSFVKNKENWGGTLQGNALLNIPEQDYNVVASSL